MAATEFTPIASALGGSLIGAAAAVFAIGIGRIAGIRGLVQEVVLPQRSGNFATSLAFLAGLVLALPLLHLAGAEGSQAAAPDFSLTTLAGGFLVGIGAAFARGCTSGHGVCGLARLSPRSFVAVPVFMATAALTVFVLRHAGGGVAWPL